MSFYNSFLVIITTVFSRITTKTKQLFNLINHFTDLRLLYLNPQGATIKLGEEVIWLISKLLINYLPLTLIQYYYNVNIS